VERELVCIRNGGVFAFALETDASMRWKACACVRDREAVHLYTERVGVFALEKGGFTLHKGASALDSKKEGVFVLEKALRNRMCFVSIKERGFALQIQKGVLA